MASVGRKLALLVPLMFALVTLQGCGSGLDGLPSLAASSPGAYRVGAGDKLRIVVQDLDNATGEYMVDSSGAISLPMIKSVSVAGKTYREIESEIEAAYLSGGFLTRPAVTVQALELRPYYVMGEVNQPGEFRYREGMTVMAALSAAGGYTYRANVGKVAITRTVDGKDITARADENTPIQPGDRIRVYERWF